MKELITMKKVKLPKPLPQTYVGIRAFVLASNIKVVSKGEGKGKRYYVDQEEVNEYCKKMFS